MEERIVSKGKVITPELEQKIIEEYQKGKSCKQIAIELGDVTKPSVQKVIDFNKLIREPKVTPEQTQEIIQLYEQGIGSPTIGEKLGVNVATVRNILKRNEIQIRPQVAKNMYEGVEKDIIYAFSKGDSVEFISESLNIDQSQIRKILYKHGLIQEEQQKEIKLKNKIIEEYSKGKGSYVIARELRVGKFKVLTVLRRENLIRNPQQQFSPEIEEGIIKKYSEGISISDISKEYKMHSSRISDFLCKKNIFKSKSLTVIEDEVIIKQYLEGGSIEKITKDHGLPAKYVRAILEKHNILEDPTIRRSKPKSHEILPVDVQENIKNQYINGDSIEKLCEQYNLTRWCIRNLLSDDNLIRKKPPNNITEELEEKIVSEYNKLKSIEELHIEFNISFYLIRKILNKNKVVRTKGGYQTSKKERDVMKYITQMGLEVQDHFIVGTKNCDIYIPSLNLVIEFLGDYWHTNPNIYEPTYYHKIIHKTAKEIWKKDKLRVEYIKSYGYDLEVIWESEWNESPRILNTILEKYVSNTKKSAA